MYQQLVMPVFTNITKRREIMKIRNATPEDSGHFVRIFEIASYGLAPHLWRQAVGNDGDTYSYALTRMQRKLADAKPNTALVAEMDGEVAGGIITYDIGPEPEEISSETDPVITPLIELENRALGTHYINAVAVFPECQRRGIGEALLHEVERNAGPNGLSLIVEDQNTGAFNLYQKLGYVTDSTAAIIKGGWDTSAQSYVLMKKAMI